MTEAVGSGRSSWSEWRDRRMAEPGAVEAYDAARLAFELGAAVRELRVAHGWSQTEPASAAGMTQSAVARFEAGGRCRRCRCSGGSPGRWTPTSPFRSSRARTWTERRDRSAATWRCQIAQYAPAILPTTFAELVKVADGGPVDVA